MMTTPKQTINFRLPMWLSNNLTALNMTSFNKKKLFFKSKDVLIFTTLSLFGINIYIDIVVLCMIKLLLHLT